ncbi:MAG: helicase C-terminal domain-containing protein [Candidatus Paceibacterota bacterium]
MWSLYENGKALKPLMFSNGKTQEDVVKETVKALAEGHKVIFIKGVCGTGKSAIALNLAKEIGRASIVVPVKGLQKQYEDDYTNKKYLLKENGEKLKIRIITGRANHVCPFLKERDEIKKIAEDAFRREKNSSLTDFADEVKPRNISETKSIDRNDSCDNPILPCKIEIKDKNAKIIKEYLKKNKKIRVSDFGAIKDVKRMSIAPVCPYWSPIVPSEMNLNLDAEKYSYSGLKGKSYNIYRRERGCGYCDQFDAYTDADVIIFNSQKYRIEAMMNRKPATEIEIIDECDEFLDSFSNQKKLNISRLNFALGNMFAETTKGEDAVNQMITCTRDLMEDKKIEEDIFKEEIIPIKETKIYELLMHFLDSDVMNAAELDEESYCWQAFETAKIFEHFFDETYVSFHKEEGMKGRELVARIITTNLEKRFRELLEKNKAIVLMSGTIHSENVLRNIFGLEDFRIIEAETSMPGRIEPMTTGSEINCRYDNFRRGRITRKQYLLALGKCIEKAKKPILVHVNSFNDLPSEQEAKDFGLAIMNREKIIKIQNEDKTGELVKRFKAGEIDILYSTKCNRGVDFPGEMCNSIIITRYPYPDVGSLFWRILKKTRPQFYNEFYIDKAKREFLQRIYRGLRSQKDHVYLLSPDARVFTENMRFSFDNAIGVK